MTIHFAHRYNDRMTSPSLTIEPSRPSPIPRPWLLPAIALLLLAGALTTLALTQTPSAGVMWPRWTAIMLVAWWLPGALLVAHWRLSDLDLPMAVVLAVAAGLCWMLLLSLIIHWWPGRIEFWPMTFVYALGSLALTVGLLWRPPHAPRPTPPTTWAWLLALLVLATFLRLPGLGYHEFHYDETIVLARARDAIRGEDDAFARHTKGPGELALATVVYRTLGTANEFDGADVVWHHQRGCRAGPGAAGPPALRRRSGLLGGRSLCHERLCHRSDAHRPVSGCCAAADGYGGLRGVDVRPARRGALDRPDWFAGRIRPGVALRIWADRPGAVLAALARLVSLSTDSGR